MIQIEVKRTIENDEVTLKTEAPEVNVCKVVEHLQKILTSIETGEGLETLEDSTDGSDMVNLVRTYPKR